MAVKRVRLWLFVLALLTSGALVVLHGGILSPLSSFSGEEDQMDELVAGGSVQQVIRAAIEEARGQVGEQLTSKIYQRLQEAGYLDTARSIGDAEEDIEDENNNTFSNTNGDNRGREDVKIYLITPTYWRPEQEAELTRMGQTLMLVPNLIWIVVEDAKTVSRHLRNILDRFPSIPKVLLAASMPAKYKRLKKGPKPRGVANRNLALRWIANNVDEGVFYFADDDNTYDLRLFHQIRVTSRLSVFPVGLVTKTGLSSPIVKNGTVIGFYDGWIANRKFPVDMAGFAVNVRHFKKIWSHRGPISMPFSPGYEEDGFLRQLEVSPMEAEPLASNCTQVLVWHTQTRPHEPLARLDTNKFRETNLVKLLESVV